MNNHIQMPAQNNTNNTTVTKKWWRSYYYCYETPSLQMKCVSEDDIPYEPGMKPISVCRFLTEKTKERLLGELYRATYYPDYINNWPKGKDGK